MWCGVWCGAVWCGVVWYVFCNTLPMHLPNTLMYSNPLEHVQMKLPSVFTHVPFTQILGNKHSLISTNIVVKGSTTNPSPLGQRCLYSSR